MIRGFVDLCTVAYVVIDDLYRAHLAPLDRRPGPEAGCTDSEVITLTLVAELVGLDEEVAFLAYVRRNHPSLFPRLPERSRYNRRRRALGEATNVVRRQLGRRVWADLPADERDLCLIDSLPVPVVGFAHATRRHRGRGHAAYGYNATKQPTIYGFKLYVLATHSGLILDFALVPAHLADGDRTTQLLAEQAHLTVLGDKAYLNAALRQHLRRERAIDLIAPTRANARTPMPALLVRLIAHFRQAIETLNGQRAAHLGIERNRAKCVSGLCARIQAKLAGHTLGLFLNQHAGQPLRALKPLALI
ncbi:MAG TPA: IS982 family transposase [Chloroflexota bacterium]